jgi:hypothetical protein
LWTILVVVV